MVALNDWKDKNNASVWYMNRFGRINFVRDEDNSLALRDWHIFYENYYEPFFDSRCTCTDCIYDALPVCDGMRWKARMRFELDGQPLKGEFTDVNAPNADTLCLSWNNDQIKLLASLEGLTVIAISDEISINFYRDLSSDTQLMLMDKNTLKFMHNRIFYSLKISGGEFIAEDENSLRIFMTSKTMHMQTTILAESFADK